MKFCGKVGFWEESVEIKKGVFRPAIVEKSYKGDILRNIQQWQQSEHQNDDLRLNNRVSIIADNYLNDHLSSIKYIDWMGTKWKVITIEVNYPRVLMDIGGVWNGSE